MLSLVFFRMINWNDLESESSECSSPRTAEEVPMGEDNNGDSMWVCLKMGYTPQ